MSIESPCRKICELDPSRDICIGCGRTRAEIGGWLAMTAAQRRAIMQRLAAGAAASATPASTNMRTARR